LYEDNFIELFIILRSICTRCHAVTLTFDLLTLNFYSISGTLSGGLFDFAQILYGV